MVNEQNGIVIIQSLEETCSFPMRRYLGKEPPYLEECFNIPNSDYHGGVKITNNCNLYWTCEQTTIFSHITCNMVLGAVVLAFAAVCFSGLARGPDPSYGGGVI